MADWRARVLPHGSLGERQCSEFWVRRSELSEGKQPPSPQTLSRPSASARVIKGEASARVFLWCETVIFAGRSYGGCLAALRVVKVALSLVKVI
jgi:hypothetical protein